MTLDCSNLKPGDRVRLRNGEIHVVEKNDGSHLPIRLDNDEWNYANGSFYNDGNVDDLDIIEILPPDPPTDCVSPQQDLNIITGLGVQEFDSIQCNGKRYVPADSLPSLPAAPPFGFIYNSESKLVGLNYDGKEFTPADAWPDTIKDRAPTKDDADPNGDVLWRTEDHEFIRYDWKSGGDLKYGWLHTPDWKPKPNPVYSREEAIDEIRQCRLHEEAPSQDLIDSIIAHLENSDE